MRTISVMNQKGGCGKTTVSINLAGALAELGRRVLVVDMDPQAHATLGLGIQDPDVEITTYELLMDPLARIDAATVQVGERLDLVTSSTVLSGVEQELADRLGREDRMAKKLSQIDDDRYDFVLIDCPPSIGLLTFNALIAAREVLIPVDASYFSLHGLGKLRETIDVIDEEMGRQLKLHVVCNNLETRTQFSQGVIDEIDRLHAGVLMESFISHTVRLKEAAAKGKPINDLDRGSKAARQFLALAREIVERAPILRVDSLQDWMERLHGPKRVEGGVLFTFDDARAATVSVTGEFANWSREGVPLARDAGDGLWKVVLNIEPGEYEYRFIVDGTWVRDPNNVDYTRNEFGQENSLLIV